MMPAASEYHRSRLKLCVSSNGHNPLEIPKTEERWWRGTAVTVLRDPGERLVSAFQDGMHIYPNLNGLLFELKSATRAAQDRICGNQTHGVQRKASSECSPLFSAEVATVVFDAFATTRGVTGCYTRLLTGAHCNDASIELNEARRNEALHRLETDFVFVGLQVRLCECPI